MNATPTGIPITHCDTCQHRHPITRRHCLECGRASAFIGAGGNCLTHTKEEA